MTDSVLSLRIADLTQTLRRFKEDEPSLTHCIEMGDPLRDGLEEAIADQVERRLKELESGGESLEQAALTQDEGARQRLLAEAWHCYAHARERSEVFFSECLEIVGGLVFRGLHLQDRIYVLADELTTQCAYDAIRRSSVARTLPSLPETRVKLLARIVGLRFPAWTIWNLPMTGHELGHVVVEGGQLVERLRLGQISQPNTVAAQRYVHELVADAFGTYVMGPAYACSAVLLSFDPLTAHDEDAGRPSDAQRAHLVFAMLRQMPDTKDMCEFQIAQVEEAWQEMLRRVGQPVKLQKSEAVRLEKLAKEIEQGFGARQLLRAGAAYPRQDWLLAKKWGEIWEQALQDGGKSLTIERKDIPVSSRLRDVLNAAWYCHLQRRKLNRPDEIHRIAEAAHELSATVMKVREDASRKGPGLQNLLGSQPRSQR